MPLITTWVAIMLTAVVFHYVPKPSLGGPFIWIVGWAVLIQMVFVGWWVICDVLCEIIKEYWKQHD